MVALFFFKLSRAPHAVLNPRNAGSPDWAWQTQTDKWFMMTCEGFTANLQTSCLLEKSIRLPVRQWGCLITWREKIYLVGDKNVRTNVDQPSVILGDKDREHACVYVRVNQKLIYWLLILLISPHCLLVCVSGTMRFLCVWWETSRICVTSGRCVRTRAAAWLRRTAVTSRRSQRLRATRTSPTSSPSSSGRWWSTSSTEPTDDATAAQSPWPSSSTMCLARGGSQCDGPSEVNSWRYWPGVWTHVKGNWPTGYMQGPKLISMRTLILHTVSNIDNGWESLNGVCNYRQTSVVGMFCTFGCLDFGHNIILCSFCSHSEPENSSW